MASTREERAQISRFSVHAAATTTIAPIPTATVAAKQGANEATMAMAQARSSVLSVIHCHNKPPSPAVASKEKSEASSSPREPLQVNSSIATRLTLVLLGFACLLPLCSSDKIEGDERRVKRCAACSMQTFDQYKQMRQEQVLNDLLRRLELPFKPNVTVDFGKLPPIGRDDPRIKALIEESVRENNRESTSDGAKRRGKRRSVGVVEGFFPALYETDARVDPPQIVFVVTEKSAPTTTPLWFISDDGQTGTASEEGSKSEAGRGQRVQLPAETAFFILSTNLQRKYVNKAILNVFIRRLEVEQTHDDMAAAAAAPTSITIEVYERHMNGSLGPKLASTHGYMDKGGQRHGSGSTEKVFSVLLNELDVQEWLQRRGVVALHVRADFAGQNLVVQPGDAVAEKMMFLELELYDSYDGRSTNRHRRNQAGTNVCQATDQNETQQCCLYDLPIDFAAVGWNFVIAPKRYNAYICNGECSVSQMTSTSRGSITHQANLDYYQCCHPKEYAGITIVYMSNNGQIWVKEVPGMVARRCGCA